MNTRHTLRLKRKARVRAKVVGSQVRPRMSVFRSNRAMSVQLIDDAKGVTLISKNIAGKTVAKGKELGAEIAKLALAKGIKTVIFDRNGYRFHGAVKGVADGAREGGLVL